MNGHQTISRFGAIQGFTGAGTTNSGSTAGYTQRVVLNGVTPQVLTNNTVGQPYLHGKFAVRGLAERFGPSGRTAAFPLTGGMSKGLGLGGTLMVVSGTFPSVQFGTWTTHTVKLKSVIVASHPAQGGPVFGDISAMGFDARTNSGMGDVQLVTPVRTVSQLPVCPLPPCAPVLGNRGAIVALTLHFAPEPSRGAMLFGACLALAWLGRRRAPHA